MTIVAALGHTFDLEIERGILAAAGIDLVDGREFEDTDDVWAGVEGVLLGTAFRLDAAAMSHMPRLRAVVRYGIGYDNVDVPAATSRAVRIGIVRDYCVEEVAEHALAGALAILRSLPHWDRNVRAGQWRSGPRQRQRRISTLTFGVMGFGLIGRVVAQKAAGLFGQVIVHDPWLQASDRVAGGFMMEPDFRRFLESVDALTLHVPLTEGTRGLLNAEKLSWMRRDAVLINASRGGLIDEVALDAALREGKLMGAALDTFAQEPIQGDNPLIGNERVLLSPHVAWLSEQAEVALRDSATRDIVRILNGEEPSAPIA